MRLRTSLKTMLALACAVGIGACEPAAESDPQLDASADGTDATDGTSGTDSTDATDGTDATNDLGGSVEGWAAEVGGNQSVSAAFAAEVAGSAAAKTASVASIDASGELVVVAEAEVAADGTFTVSGIGELAAPFVVETASASGETVGRVLVTSDVAANATVKILPVSHETTVETNTYLELIAGGSSHANVDAISLMMRITAETASNAKSEVELAANVSASLEAEAAVAGESSADMEAAKAEAFSALVAEIHAGTASADAWSTFMAKAQADMSTKLDISLQAVATATAAGNAAYEQKAGDSPDSAAAHAWLQAHAEAAVFADAAAEFSSGVSTQFESAYGGFFTALAEAESEADMDQAQAGLTAALSTGEGATLEAATFLEANGEADTALAIQTAIDATVEASATLEAAVDAAGDTGAIVEAFTAFQASIDGAKSSATGTGVSGDMAIIATLAATQAGSEAGALIDVTLAIEAVVNLLGSIDVNGFVDAGAAGLAEGLAGIPDLGSADSASLIGMANGQASVLATSDVDGNGAYAFELPAQSDFDSYMVEVSSAGDVVGATLVDADLGTPGSYSNSAITFEGTVETLVAMDAGQDADMELIAKLCTDATAKAVLAEDQVAAFADFVVTAQAVLDGADGEAAAYGSLDAVASVVLEGGAGSVVSAETQLHAASAATAEVVALFEGNGEADAAAEAEAAMQAMADGIATAMSDAEVNAAGEAYSQAMLGDGAFGGADGALEGWLAGLQLNVLAQSSVEAALSALAQAGTSLQAAHVASADAAGSSSFDASAFVAATAQANAAFEAAGSEQAGVLAAFVTE
ncbi:MAG: hypothetical protein ACI9OJ_001367, partial [Myxococcota bacterium]